MGVLDLQTMDWSFPSIEWTPAACFLTLQLVCMLGYAIAFLAGKADVFYKIEPHTKKQADASADFRVWEFSHGGHMMHWALCACAACWAGGAQLMCIFMLPSMAIFAYYHWAEGGKPSAMAACICILAEIYFGFEPMPVLHSIEWSPVVYWVIIHSLMCFPAALMFLLAPEKLYKDQPYTKRLASRSFEVCHGAFLLGATCAEWVCVLTGGAPLVCLLQTIALAFTGYCHFSDPDGKDGKGRGLGIFTVVIIVMHIGFGLLG